MAIDRRERLTESCAAAGFFAGAVAMAWFLPAEPVSAATAAWLVALFCVLHHVAFDVGEGRTRPIQLVLIPMLLLLPPAAVPLVVAAALIVAHLPAVAARREPGASLSLALADGWFALAPALVLAFTGIPEDPWTAAGVVALAVAAQLAVDFVTAALRLRIGLGLRVREELAGFGWVYAVDILLTPIAALAAVAGRDAPLTVAAVLPLAALLAIFARERRGRIENALEVNRLVSESEQRLQSIIQNSSDLILIVARDGTLGKLTGAVAGVFGDDPDAAVGSSLFAHVHPDDVSMVRAFLDRVAIDGASAGQALDWRLRRADGGHRYVETVATNLLGDERLAGIVLTARDVEDRKAFEEQLRHRAFHDPLTQLANRGLFYDRIEHALSAQTRREHRVGVLFLDLDDFKVINDVHGHAAGDELLVGVAQRLRDCLRSADTAARLGGDEFGVLIEGVAGPNEPVQAAERILAAFTEPIEVGDTGCWWRRASASPSAGPATRRRRAAAPGRPRHVRGQAPRQAPLGALRRRARAVGRARAPTTTPRRGSSAGTSSARRSSRCCAAPTRSSAVFQPVLDLRTGLVSGYEALARFATPRAAPAERLVRPGAPRRPRLRARGTRRRHGAGRARPPRGHLPDAQPQPVRADLQAGAGRAARAPGRPRDRDHRERARRRRPRLQRGARRRPRPRRPDRRRRRGRRLRRAQARDARRPDLIKLDRSLVAGVHDDPARAALISAFVRFARDSDATVCAEGIESLDELTRLADLDVTYGQGYVIARPGPDWPAAAAEAAAACAARSR